LSCFGFLVNTDGEVAHLSGRIGECLVFAELIRYAVHGYSEQRCACRYGLRHNYGAPLVTYSCRHCGRSLYAAFGFHRSVAKVYPCPSYQVGNEHSALCLLPFAVGKACALGKCYAGVGHAVGHGQTYYSVSRGHVGHLSPQKVAGLISAHHAVLRRLALVALHGERVGVYALRTAEGIVSVDVNVCVVVFPVDVVGRVPFGVGGVVCMAHVVCPVAARLQSAGRVAVIVDNIHAHHVAVGKPAVVYSRNRQLVNLARQCYAVAAAAAFVSAEKIVRTACQ